MDRLTRTPFFESARNNNFHELESQYLNFAQETYKICLNSNRLELFFTLSYTLTELLSAPAQNFYINKAISLLEQAVELIKSDHSIVQQQPATSAAKYIWTGKSVHLVELVYSIAEMRCVNNGDVGIAELIDYIATMFGVQIKDCFGAYCDIKRRKGDSRTYFLDQLRERLNDRMERDDQKERI